ncbi:MAG: sulfurtransferase TusA family protein [Candidatus Odinarchaeia archaeon]
MSEKPTKTLDFRGLNCPMPIVKTKKEIQTIDIGQILEVWTTDPGAKEDFPRWAKRTGNEIINVEEKGDYTAFYIKRNA